MISETASGKFSKTTFSSEQERVQFIIDSIEQSDHEITKYLAESGIYGDFILFVEQKDAEFILDPTNYKRNLASTNKKDKDLIPNKNKKYKLSVLHLAVKSKDPRKVRVLLENGANVNEGTDEEVTPLILACALDIPDVVDVLLYWDDVDVNAQTIWGQTALHYAAMSGDEELLVKLLRQLADPHLCDIEGRSPLHLAVEKGDFDLSVALMKFGADPSGIRRSDGATAFHVAVAGGHENIVRTMVDWGVKIDIVYHDGKLNLGMFNLSEEEIESRRQMMERFAKSKEKESWLSRMLTGFRNMIIGPDVITLGERSTRTMLNDL